MGVCVMGRRTREGECAHPHRSPARFVAVALIAVAAFVVFADFVDSASAVVVVAFETLVVDRNCYY